MGLIITTKDDDVSEAKTTKGSDVIINGKNMSAIKNTAPVLETQERSILVINQDNLRTLIELAEKCRTQLHYCESHS